MFIRAVLYSPIAISRHTCSGARGPASIEDTHGREKITNCTPESPPLHPSHDGSSALISFRPCCDPRNQSITSASPNASSTLGGRPHTGSLRFMSVGNFILVSPTASFPLLHAASEICSPVRVCFTLPDSTHRYYECSRPARYFTHDSRLRPILHGPRFQGKLPCPPSSSQEVSTNLTSSDTLALVFPKHLLP